MSDSWPLLIVVSLSFASTLPVIAQGGSKPPGEIRAELERVRAEAAQHSETRGASPRLTMIKHRLRDWVESQLGDVPSDPNDDPDAQLPLAARLNAQLKQEHLFREDESAHTGDFWTRIGFLGEVRLEYKQRQTYLVLRTAVEVHCGFDESAYLYRFQDGHWKRLWGSEQNSYTKEKYLVQSISAVLVSPPLNEAHPYVLTLGTEPWCSSNWHDVYVRLWSLSSSGEEPKLLLDKSDWAYLGAHDIPIQGSVGRKDALVEYTVGSLDPGLHSREAVLHYAIQSEKAERINPVALSPRDFVEEWLKEPWEQSRHWSSSLQRAALKKAHRDTGRDEFIQPTRHCRTPDLWQVGLGSQDGKKRPVYFLVRWRPPYDFTMIQVSKRSPGCTQKDPAADDEYRTLFPVQDWRE